MTALPILPPFPVFTGLDGMPLDNGSIYVGTAGLDPITNPVAIYWDDALTIAAAQPVATSGGYAVRAGTPSIFYADATSVSIKVQDQYGVTVFYAASLDAISVGLSGGTTGLTVSGSPVTGAGTMTLGGTLEVAHGGTGGTTQATARAGIGAAASGANTDITSLEQDVAIAETGAAAANTLGFRGLPVVVTTGKTLELSDQGKTVYTSGAIVIPANATVAFPIGTAIAISNSTNATVSISITTDTLRQAGTTNTGTRTLAVYGDAVLKKLAATEWRIIGNVS
jgi:hypothetical protein